jgi:hypothetical protein
MRFRLLWCLAKAAVKHGVKYLMDQVPGGGPVYDMVVDAWEDYRRNEREDALRVELQALVQAPPDQVRQEVEAAVRAEAAGWPEATQRVLAAYLTQVPAAIRRSLRRHSDPSGSTVPPSLSLRYPFTDRGCQAYKGLKPGEHPGLASPVEWQGSQPCHTSRLEPP